jgi:hypothetical protein
MDDLRAQAEYSILEQNTRTIGDARLSQVFISALVREMMNHHRKQSMHSKSMQIDETTSGLRQAS